MSEIRGEHPTISAQLPDPVTVPLVIYRNGERLVIGQARIDVNGVIVARVDDGPESDAILKTINAGSGYFSFDGASYAGDKTSPGDFVFDGPDSEAKQRDGRAQDGSPSLTPSGD